MEGKAARDPETGTPKPADIDKPRYERVLIKLSGEALMGFQDFGVDPAVMGRIASEIGEVQRLGVETSVVVGGGNIIRGVQVGQAGFDRTTGDYMGMLATVINALALQTVLESQGIDTRVLSAFRLAEVAEPFIRRRAIRHLEKGRVVILAAGTGNPYFSTDTAAALRAMELKADVVVKATKVDGIFDSDPSVNEEAKFLRKVTYLDVMEKGLKVMDMTAVSLCMDNSLPIIVVNLRGEGNIKQAVLGREVGSLITG